MKIAILGCGPAGLFAAHAAVTGGHEVTIFSKPRKSFMHGAQYLHRPIPGLSTDAGRFVIDYRLQGTIEGYREKVYGADSTIEVSVESLVGLKDAWDIREAYNAAWVLYKDRIQPYDVMKHSPSETAQIRRNNDLVISTIPANALCHGTDCTFDSEDVWSTDWCKDANVPEDTVVCSGDPDDWWYRESRIQGYENTEYPYNRKPANTNVWRVVKPITNTCDCYPEFVRMGRYGAWQKGVLSDAAYYDTAIMTALMEVAK